MSTAVLLCYCFTTTMSSMSDAALDWARTRRLADDDDDVSVRAMAIRARLEKLYGCNAGKAPIVDSSLISLGSTCGALGFLGSETGRRSKTTTPKAAGLQMACSRCSGYVRCKYLLDGNYRIVPIGTRKAASSRRHRSRAVHVYTANYMSQRSHRNEPADV